MSDTENIVNVVILWGNVKTECIGLPAYNRGTVMLVLTPPTLLRLKSIKLPKGDNENTVPNNSVGLHQV